jgi:putative addiction module antidote
MLLKLTLRRTGNSVGLVLPKEALDHLGAGEGDTVFLAFLAEGALRLSTADPEFEGKVQAAEEINRQYGNAIRALVRRSI